MTFPTDTWQAASIDQQDGSNEAPDPGPSGKATFDVALDDARAFVSKAGNAVIVLDLRVTGGPMDSYQWSELRGLKTDGQVKAAKATCARLGVDVGAVTGLEDLDALLKERVGNFYEIDVVQNGEYRNVYVQGPASDVQSSFPSREQINEARTLAESAKDEQFGADAPWD